MSSLSNAKIEREKILIIDDDANTVRMLSAILKRRGFQTTTTTDSRQGIELTKELCPAVVLCDYVMPGTDGPDVARQIVEMGIGTQVILMTGFVDPSKAVRAIQSGATDYMHKPFTKVEELLEPLEQAIYRYHRWRSIVQDAFKRCNRDPSPKREIPEEDTPLGDTDL